ncbi:MAG: HAD family hydrolase [Actinomycetota bacterium]
MSPHAFLLDLYDTVVHGDWAGWRTELASLSGLDPDAIGMAYHLTREARNVGAYATPEDDMRALLEAAGIADPDPALVRRLVEAESAFGGDRVQLYDDSLITIAALRARGDKTALVSNCSSGTRAIVERLGLVEAFDAVVLSFELGARKPSVAIYQEALRGLDADPIDAIFVDDQTAYCDGARALGIDTRLIVRDGAEPAEGFAPTTNGHTVIADLTSLL